MRGDLGKPPVLADGQPCEGVKKKHFTSCGFWQTGAQWRLYEAFTQLSQEVLVPDRGKAGELGPMKTLR